ncbi:hypothetical protein K438DRAFT_1782560 [Mycena galopus ATCC 62051]|nr:hypothetical protein K438DRAFT_1782560 [Mycena galopus ATCC 62051]
MDSNSTSESSTQHNRGTTPPSPAAAAASQDLTLPSNALVPLSSTALAPAQTPSSDNSNALQRDRIPTQMKWPITRGVHHFWASDAKELAAEVELAGAVENKAARAGGEQDRRFQESKRISSGNRKSQANWGIGGQGGKGGIQDGLDGDGQEVIWR